MALGSCMTIRTLTLLTVLLVVYTGCSKQGDVITHPADRKAVANDTTANEVARHFTLGNVCGTYIVSGTGQSYSRDDGSYLVFTNDTVFIRQCDDSSIAYYCLYSQNLLQDGMGFHCYASTATTYGFGSNYQFANRQGVGKVAIYFPANSPDSIYLVVNNDRACQGEDMKVCGVRIK